MNKLSSLLLVLITSMLAACGGGGSTPTTNNSGNDIPATPTATKDVVAAFAAGQEWKTSVADKQVVIQVNDKTSGQAIGDAMVSLFSIAKTDPTDGTAITDPKQWIRKGLVATGITASDGRLTISGLLLPDAASTELIVVATKSAVDNTLTVTSARYATGIATVGSTTALTME